MRKRALKEMPEWAVEAVDRRDWRRFLSPVDREWTWQDSAAITAVREFLIRISEIPRAENSFPPPYEERAATEGQLKVLEVLAAASSAIDMVEREMKLLVLELRAREVSWDVIAMALGCRRQTAHRKYGDLDWPYWNTWLVFEVNAARRVALEIAQSPDVTDDEREQALDFLERSDFPEQVRTTKKLRRLHR